MSKTKPLLHNCLIVSLCLSVILALSSCGGNENKPVLASQDQASASPSASIPAASIEPTTASVSPSDEVTDSSCVVAADQLDTGKAYVKLYDAYGQVTLIQLERAAGDDDGN
jgi:hypothetical protein